MDAASAQDFNTGNMDYYSPAYQSGLNAVETYHLGPCEKALQGRNFPKAVAECHFILRIYPNHPRALLLMAKTCEQWASPMCRIDEYFERAIQVSPTAAPTYVVQGIHLHNVKRYAQAKQSYEMALKLDDTSVNAHYNLGLTCFELKDYACANEHAQKAYALGATVPGLRDKLQKAGQWKPQ
jgi:tetratricopeptide (TPR) repeat protein